MLISFEWGLGHTSAYCPNMAASCTTVAATRAYSNAPSSMSRLVIKLHHLLTHSLGHCLHMQHITQHSKLYKRKFVRVSWTSLSLLEEELILTPSTLLSSLPAALRRALLDFFLFCLSSRAARTLYKSFSNLSLTQLASLSTRTGAGRGECVRERVR